MPTPFSSQDLGRIFDGRTLTHGGSLGLAGGVAVQRDGDTLLGVVREHAAHLRVRITPSRLDIDPRWLFLGVFEFAPALNRPSWLYVISG